MIVSLSGLSKGCSTHRLTSRKCSGNAYRFAWKKTGLSNGVLQTDWRLGNVLVMLTVLTARWQYLCQVCLRGVLHTDWQLGISPSFSYSAILRSRADSLRSCLNEWLAFCSAFSLSTEVVNLQRCLVVTWLVPRETAAISARSVDTIRSCTMSCHFMQSHTHRVYACLVVTWHLHFWQNDRDLLRATAVTRGWNRYRNKSQHR